MSGSRSKRVARTKRLPREHPRWNGWKDFWQVVFWKFGASLASHGSTKGGTGWIIDVARTKGEKFPTLFMSSGVYHLNIDAPRSNNKSISKVGNLSLLVSELSAQCFVLSVWVGECDRQLWWHSPNEQWEVSSVQVVLRIWMISRKI